MKAFIYTLSFLVLPFFINAQTRIQSTGNLPKDFTEKAKQKRSSSKKKSKMDKAEDGFKIQSKYSIKQLMRSGVVLFNDPATNYLNQVMAKLPYKSKSRAKAPRVYALNSPAVNAFATNEGVICVTLGLLARLEDEAQLAFILAHEIMHIEHNHTVKTFVHKYEMEQNSKHNGHSHHDGHNHGGTGVGGNNDFDPSLLKKSMFSHKLETEADDEGFELFAKSEYSSESLGNVFKILFYADMPFTNASVDRNLFDRGDYKFPEGRWPTEVEPIRPFEHYEDKTSTHPSAFKRQQSLSKKLGNSKTGKSKYLVGASKFDEIKELAQYQLPFLHLEDGAYSHAIYTAHVLDETGAYEDDFKKVIGKALYQKVAKKKTDSDRKKDFEDSIRGELGTLDNFLNILSEKELTTLAASYNLHLLENHKEDAELELIVDASFIKMKKHYNSLSEFRMNNKTAYWQSAFSKKEIMDQAQIKMGQRSKIKFRGKNMMADMSQNEQRKFLKKGQALGLKNVLVVNPSFVSIHGKSSSLQCVRSEQKEADLLKSFKELASKTRVKAKIIDPAIMSTRNADQMNDLHEINKYMSQVLKNSEEGGVIPTNYGKIQELAKKYKTKNFLMPIMMSSSMGKSISLVDLTGLYYKLAFPALIPYTLLNKREVMYASIIVNAETGNVSLVDMAYGRMNDRKLSMDAMVYNTLFQIGKKKK